MQDINTDYDDNKQSKDAKRKKKEEKKNQSFKPIIA